MRNDVQKIKWLLFNYTTRKVNASIVSLLGTLRTRTTSKFCCVFSHTPRIAVRKLCYSDRQPRDRFCPFCSSGLHVMTQFSARVYLQSYRLYCWVLTYEGAMVCALCSEKTQRATQTTICVHNDIVFGPHRGGMLYFNVRFSTGWQWAAGLRQREDKPCVTHCLTTLNRSNKPTRDAGRRLIVGALLRFCLLSKLIYFFVSYPLSECVGS